MRNFTTDFSTVNKMHYLDIENLTSTFEDYCRLNNVTLKQAVVNFLDKKNKNSHISSTSQIVIIILSVSITLIIMGIVVKYVNCNVKSCNKYHVCCNCCHSKSDDYETNNPTDDISNNSSGSTKGSTVLEQDSNNIQVVRVIK